MIKYKSRFKLIGFYSAWSYAASVEKTQQANYINILFFCTVIYQLNAHQIRLSEKNIKSSVFIKNAFKAEYVDQ